MFTKYTEAQYLTTGHLIQLPDPKAKKRRWYQVFRRTPTRLYMVQSTTSRYSATMTLFLVDDETGEERRITVAPNRGFTYYVRESL